MPATTTKSTEILFYVYLTPDGPEFAIWECGLVRTLAEAVTVATERWYELIRNSGGDPKKLDPEGFHLEIQEIDGGIALIQLRWADPKTLDVLFKEFFAVHAVPVGIGVGPPRRLLDQEDIQDLQKSRQGV